MLAVYRYSVRIENLRVTFKYFYAGIIEQLPVNAVEPVNFAILIGNQFRPINAPPAHCPAETGGISKVVRVMRGVNQKIFWDAADIHAGAAKRSRFDHCGFGTVLRGALRMCKAAAAAADAAHAGRVLDGIAWAAGLLGVPPEQVVFVAEYCGGGFGSKGAPYALMVLPAYMSKKIGRPVMMRVTRAEEYFTGSARAGGRAGPGCSPRRGAPRAPTWPVAARPSPAGPAPRRRCSAATPTSPIPPSRASPTSAATASTGS